jgi:cell division protein FtsN
MAGAFREEKNADKIFKRLSKLGYKAKRIEANKYGLYPVLYGSYATYAEADKAKRNSENGQSRSLALIESLNIKPI